MFGLSENNDKNNSNTPTNGVDNTMNPSSNGVSSPDPSAPSDPNLAAASAELVAATKGTGAPQVNSGSVNDVNLGDAYKANDPLNAKPDADAAQTKPTTASLPSNTPEDDLIKLKQQALQNLAPLWTIWTNQQKKNSKLP